MTNKTSRYLNILVVAIGIIVAYSLIQYVATMRQETALLELEDVANAYHSRAKELAATIARLGTDDVADQIVSSCTTEILAEYNLLLGRLSDNLSITELQTLDRHFGRCGYRNYQRRAILLLQLQSHVAQLTVVADVITHLTNSRPEKYQITEWNDLVAAEVDITTQFKELTEQQDLIIQTLLLGQVADSAEINDILQSVRETRNAMTVRSLQLNDIRERLVSS